MVERHATVVSAASDAWSVRNRTGKGRTMLRVAVAARLNLSRSTETSEVSREPRAEPRLGQRADCTAAFATWLHIAQHPRMSREGQTRLPSITSSRCATIALTTSSGTGSSSLKRNVPLVPSVASTAPTVGYTLM